MDIIELHGRAVGRYKEYIRSFIDIRDADIRDEVTHQLNTGKLWPEPLMRESIRTGHPTDPRCCHPPREQQA